MRRISFLVALTLSLALMIALVPGRQVAAGPATATVEVSAVDSAFEPETITINVGDTVNWTNNGQLPHTVTASDGSWDSGNMDPGATFSHTFDTPGTYTYYCKYHGTAEGAGMAATVVVQAQQQPAATPAIEAGDQPVTNDTVMVDRVVAAQDGWVVVHANTAENTPGEVLGQTHVSAGESTDVQVMLSRAASVGEKLWPMLHVDEGTPGTYEFPGADGPVTVDGKVVMVQITVTEAQQQPTVTPAIEAGDQPVTNDTVMVDRVVAAQDGWVVVHANTAENKPGEVLGQTHVSAGESTDVQVMLSRAASAGEKLWPMLHVDEGTPGTYEFPGADGPVTVDGKVVMVQITVTEAQPTVTPAIEAGNQPVTNNTVMVDRVVAAQDGWVVVHANTADNKPGEVLGQTHVSAGESTNVQVALSQAVSAGEKLWPMLHVDEGAMGTYEFPGADVPVTADGNVVMVQITVTGTPAALPETSAGGLSGLWLILGLAGALLLSGALVLRRRTA